jgi:hypothetical protein
VLVPYHPPTASSPRSTVPWLDRKVHVEKSQL